MQCSVERRTNEVGHPCIYDDELFVGRSLGVEAPCNEVAALSNDGPSKFEMKLLAMTKFEELFVHLKIVLEIGDGFSMKF